MDLNVTSFVKLDMSSAQKALDAFMKEKRKLNIDVNITGFDNFQKDIRKFQDAVDKIVAARKKLEESVGNGNLTTQQVEALKLIEQKEKELASQREQMMKEFAALQEQITKVRLEGLERIKAKEQENAAKTEATINRQAAAFQKMYGSLKEGVKLPITGGTEDMAKAIRSMEGFSEANVKAVGSAQAGEITLDRYIATLKNVGGGFDTYKISVDNATGSVYQLDQGLKSTDAALIRTSETANGVINGLAGALVAAGIGRTLGEIKDLLWDCAEASIEFESALADVRKTTNLPVEQIQEIKEEILSLANEIPVAAVELSRIAEIGGQLNIPKENIIDFTHVMADLGATTVMTSAEAADFVARFSNITQIPMGSWERLSSALVSLGNNFAGSEAEIAEMTLRLAAAGQQAKMSEAGTLGLSAALVAVGLKAEMAGTAFSKAMNRINIAVNTGNEELENFARVAGMSTQDFVEIFNEDASSALIAFVQGLGDVERLGKNTIVLMDELGLTEVRMSDALRRASASGDLFKSAIEMSNQAFEENVALQQEAEIRYATTESQMLLLSNATNQLKIVIGDALTPAINNATDGITDFTLGAADFVEQNKWLVQALTVLTVLVGTATGGITIYAIAIKGLTAAKLALAAAAGTAAKANAGLMATLVATPLGPVILALSAVAAAVTAVTIAVGESKRESEQVSRIALENGSALKAEAEGLESQKQRAVELRNELARGNLTQAEANAKRTELMSIQDELIEKYGGEAKAVDLLGDSVDELKVKYDDLIESAAQTYLTDNAKAINEAEKYVNEAHSPNEGFSAGTKVFFSDNAEKQMDKEVRDFMKSLSDSLGGKYGFAKKWDWDQWVFGGTSTELRFDDVTTEQYLEGLRTFSEKVREYGFQTGKDVSHILGDISSEINEWDSEGYKQRLAILDKATEAEAVSTYRKQYKDILDAQAKFNEAYADGDAERSEEALQGVIGARDAAVAAVGDDTALQDYFKKMAEEQVKAFENWKDTVSQNVDVDVPTKPISLSEFLSVEDSAKSLDEATKSIDRLKTLLTDIKQLTKGDMIELAIEFKDDSFLSIDPSTEQGVEQLREKLRSLSEQELSALASSMSNVSEVQRDELITAFRDSIRAAEETKTAFAGINEIKLSDVANEFKDFASTMSTLDTAYAAFKDKEKKLSATEVLNLAEPFKDLSSYENFVNVAMDSKSSAKRVQSAFNDMATEFVYTSGILNGLTHENENLYVSMLKAQGIANAQEIVMSNYAEGLKLATENNYDMAESSVDAANKLLAEADASDEARKSFAGMVLQKQILNGLTINTTNDVNALIALAKQAGATAEVMSTLASIKKAQFSLESLNPNDRYSASDADKIESFIKEQEAKIKSLAEKANFANYTPIQVDYDGGDATKKATSKKDKKVESFEKEYDNIQRKLQNVKRKIDDALAKLTDFSTISDQSKAYSKVTKLAKSQIKTIDKGVAYYDKEIAKIKKKLTKSQKDTLADVLDGSISIETLKAKGEKGTKAEKRLADRIDKALSLTEKKESLESDRISVQNSAREYQAKRSELEIEKLDLEIEKVKAKKSKEQVKIDVKEAKGASASISNYKRIF